MQLNASAALYEELFNKQQNFFDILKGEQIVTCDTIEDLVAHHAIHGLPILEALQGQSDESIEEQNRLLQVCASSIDAIFEGRNPRSLLLVGPPGAGKTHVALTALAYALAKRLTVEVTALTSERARRLTGEHLHLLFDFPVASLNTPVSLNSVFSICKNTH